MTPEDFRGKSALIASIHQKEIVMAPLLHELLGLNVQVAAVDTDAFGTFSGEIERTLSPLETALAKAQMALEHEAADFALASEGSFGPHPSLYFLPSDHELVVLWDGRNKRYFTGSALSTHTNFSAEQISSNEQLLEWAERAKFPSHRIILKGLNAAGDVDEMKKAIGDRDTLIHTFKEYQSRYTRVQAETDMRAMYNPFRMEVIKEATLNLIQNIQTRCPQCGAAGFVVKETIAGLPCGQCFTPTRLSKYKVSICEECRHREQQPASDQTFADPMYCDVCNP